MISRKTEAALSGSSVIRAMFEEGNRMAERYGRENVYDFSLGNPMTPPPEKLKSAVCRLTEETDPLLLHGYMNNAGFPEVRSAVAEDLNRRFCTAFRGDDVVMTVGAAGGLNVALKTILDPGDEVVVFAPFFGEYQNYIRNFDGEIVIVPPDPETFHPDLTALEQRITDRTKAVIINTPNNPTGVVYGDGTLRGIAGVLQRAEERLGREIYLLSDEPYRELLYDGAEPRMLTDYYRDTVICYSFSKSLSLPGERIGYLLVPEECADREHLISGFVTNNRILGFVNAPSLIQKAVAECLGEKTDVEFYDRNRRLLFDGLTRLGFSCVKPEGAFYLWMKTPGEDPEAFIAKAKEHHLLLVNGAAFSCPGYVRLAYCVSHKMIERSLPAFEKLAEAYFG